MNIARPVGSEISSVDFGFFKAADIRKLSVKQITNPQILDSFGHPISGGLYDLCLGAFLRHPCATCRLDDRFCPGHMGHIELPIPVYNPLFFSQMFSLLRSMCLFCHKFKLKGLEIHRYSCKLQLLQHGLVLESNQVDDFHLQSVKSTDNDDEAMEIEEDDTTTNKGQSKVNVQSEQDLIKRREDYVRNAIQEALAIGDNDPKSATVTEERRKVIHELMRVLLSRPKCDNCGVFSPPFRKDGFTKLFAGNLSDRQQMNNRIKGAANLSVSAHHNTKKPAPKDESIPEVDGEEQTKTSSASHYVLSTDVQRHLQLLFKKENGILNLVFHFKSSKNNKCSADMFFIKYLAVPPTRFRPASKLGDEIHENIQNELLTKILNTNLLIRDLNERVEELSLLKQQTRTEEQALLFSRLMNAFVTIQNDVNVFIDSSKNSQQVAQGRVPPPGIKQTLEKKEGLFRKHMMGKRVNFAARSVISPDPNIETYEIGLPPVFAVKLTYPEPVTPYNAQELRSAVINGPTTWPGATAIQREDGTVIALHSMSLEQRTALANQLQTPTNGSSGVVNKKVLRHIRNGDVVIMNRQPTLHKASMMGHRVRVLPGEKTLRLHYANTGAYNADFDGDEMNLHFPQNENARAEAMWLANTDSQYLTPTSGKPLRGLIQDHISTGVWLTNKDTFLTREQYQQLIYGAIRPEDGFIQSSKIITVPPSVVKPVPMWTGKQVISTILENLKPLDRPGLNLTGKNKIKDDYWGSSSEENTVLFKDGKLLCGVLDKSQFGATDHGMVHAIHEIYGPDTAGRLLGSLGRLFTKYVQSIGFTCGMDDLHLSTDGDKWRSDILNTSDDVGLKAALSTVSLPEDSTDEKNPELRRRLQDVLRDDNKLAVLDMVTQSRVNAVTSSIVSKTIPAGTLKKFPRNSMQEMALSGAKGSNVNVSQIMCLLGQQALEGRRVPIMVSGKSLPSFKAFETNARAGGFITGRFFSGIKPQEYYFHCMAGREGLIDTAVKTSRSGYLQRCLIKPLEGVKTDYDGTVRDSDGTMIQFLYGGDDIDVTRESYLSDFDFCLQNFDSLLSKHNLEGVSDNLDTESAVSYAKKVRKRRAKEANLPAYARSEKYDPVISKYQPSFCLGSVSETFQDKLEKYIDSNELLAKKSEKGKKSAITGKKFRALMQLKYMQSVIDPGEAVGIIASQSIGEPSTQMTLNTFHFAGHGAANVTLGIPRMREIIMTASAHIKTPQMTLPILDDVTDQQADNFCKSVARVVMSELVDNVIVEEKSGIENDDGTPSRTYKIRVNFFTHKEYSDEYDINPSDLDNVISSKFLVNLTSVISKEIRKQKKVQSGTRTDAAVPEIGKEEKKALSDDIRPKNNEPQGDYDKESDSDKSDSSDAEDNDPSSDEESSSEDEKEAEAEADKALDGDSQKEENSDSDMEEENEKVAKAAKAVRSKQAKEREQEIKGLFPNVTRFDFDFEEGGWCEITLQYPANTKKLLMVNIVEQVCKDVVVREVLRIGRCLRPAAKAGEIRRFTTEGVNFQAMWDQNDFIDVNSITSNDIAQVLKIYGVEAARQTIVNEINNVFGTYAIAVSPRHLELIADMMTREGTYLPFNRQGIEANSSPFLKMSFETTCQFLQKAVLDGDTDLLDSPSSRLVVGRVSKIGTGTFDLLNPSPSAISV